MALFRRHAAANESQPVSFGATDVVEIANALGVELHRWYSDRNGVPSTMTAELLFDEQQRVASLTALTADGRPFLVDGALVESLNGIATPLTQAPDSYHLTRLGVDISGGQLNTRIGYRHDEPPATEAAEAPSEQPPTTAFPAVAAEPAAGVPHPAPQPAADPVGTSTDDFQALLAGHRADEPLGAVPEASPSPASLLDPPADGTGPAPAEFAPAQVPAPVQFPAPLPGAAMPSEPAAAQPESYPPLQSEPLQSEPAQSEPAQPETPWTAASEPAPQPAEPAPTSWADPNAWMQSPTPAEQAEQQAPMSPSFDEPPIPPSWDPLPDYPALHTPEDQAPQQAPEQMPQQQMPEQRAPEQQAPEQQAPEQQAPEQQAPEQQYGQQYGSWQQPATPQPDASAEQPPMAPPYFGIAPAQPASPVAGAAPYPGVAPGAEWSQPSADGAWREPGTTASAANAAPEPAAPEAATPEPTWTPETSTPETTAPETWGAPAADAAPTAGSEPAQPSWGAPAADAQPSWGAQASEAPPSWGSDAPQPTWGAPDATAASADPEPVSQWAAQSEPTDVAPPTPPEQWTPGEWSSQSEPLDAAGPVDSAAYPESEQLSPTETWNPASWAAEDVAAAQSEQPIPEQPAPDLATAPPATDAAGVPAPMPPFGAAPLPTEETAPRADVAEPATAPPSDAEKPARPVLVFDQLEVGPDDLAAQLPLQGELLYPIPGPDRPDYCLVLLQRPLTFQLPADVDASRFAPEFVQHLPEGGVVATVPLLVIAARFQGTQIAPDLSDLWVNVAYVTDNSVAQDAQLDFSKVHYAAIARINLVG